jgi:cysteinyl-tRNA synthetase
MSLKIHNTLSRQKEEFNPNTPGRVTMYVCGPNLYGPSHVGHAFSYIIFDTIKRYLKFRGYQIHHVQNFTDIEDRIIATAQKETTTIQALSEKYIDRFLREMDALNVQRADAYPRATGVVPKIIEIIQGLIAKGYAYAVGGYVYFRSEGPDYGKPLTVRSTRWKRARALRWMSTKRTRWISYSGEQRDPASRPGTAPGERVARAGTSNARR